MRKIRKKNLDMRDRTLARRDREDRQEDRRVSDLNAR